MTGLRVWFLGLMMALLAYTPSPARAQNDDRVPRFEPSACPFDVPEDEHIDCGYMVVAQRHADPDGPTIRLAVAILKSHSASPAPDPVVYLEGGPGGSALEGWDHWLLSPFLASRDLVLVDQRGTGYSEPSLYCPESDDVTSEYLDDLLSDEEWERLGEEAAQACRDRLTGEGIDVSVFNSSENAADIDDLRAALGYEAINLYSISYGTFLAQVIMRDHPEGIRSVVLDSTVPLGVNMYEEYPANTARAFDTLFASCAADPACSEAFPDLEAEVYAFVERANEHPFWIWIRNPYTKQIVRSPMKGNDVLEILFQSLYDYTVIPYLPLMLHKAAHGDYRMLASYSEFYLKSWAESKFSLGMYYSVECRDEVIFNDQDAAREAADTFDKTRTLDDIDSIFATCALWDVGTAESLLNEQVASQIPTLVLAGGYDPITPPNWGRRVAESLPNSLFLEFPSLSHGTTLDECAGGIAASFVNHPDAALPTGCHDIMTKPEFATALTPVRSIYPLINAFLVDADWVQIGILVLLVLLSSLGAVVWPILRLAHLWRRRLEQPSIWVRLAAILGFLVSGWNLLFVIGLVAVIFIAFLDFENVALVFFGLPQWGAPLMLMPWVSIVSIIPLAILNVPIWRQPFWGWTGRVFYLVLLATAVGFGAWLVQWAMLGWPF